jgi:Sulfotransferase domain
MNVDDIRSTEMVPKLIHTYQHHHLDSTRWAHFTPRDDDIVISTPYKSGTTWTQEIVLHRCSSAERSHTVGMSRPGSTIASTH